VKTKRVHGVDLSSHCFAYVGCETDTSTWHGCIHVLGDTTKTMNAIKNSLGRFSETKGIPANERETVWHTIRGAALALGIRVREHAKNEVPAKVAEHTPQAKPPKTPAEELLSEKELKEFEALADIKADLFLKQLGID
jgi:hypothetical protein